MPNLKHVRIGLFLAFVTCFTFPEISFAAQQKTIIKKIEFTEKNTLEIQVSGKNNFKIFTLENPNRLVVDLENSDFEKAEYSPTNPNFISDYRAKKTDKGLRLVFDLKQKISIEKIKFEKIKNQPSGKITAQIFGVKIIPKKEPSPTKSQAPIAQNQTQNKSSQEDFITSKVAEFDVETTKVINPDGSAKYIVRKIPKNIPNPIYDLQRMPIIVIDSGHGGKDPGTIGNFARTKEKNITLSYAKELGKQLINTKRYKVYLTRDNDTFIPLRERVAKARKRKADLFISIHANAAADTSASGFSIYTLSETSSDKQAELLAQKENRADIINGMDFSGASQDIIKTLIDLSQRESKNSSARFASMAIKSVSESGIEVLQNTHRFAGFAVLTAPDMASVLIELGYLSNKDEERLLNSLGYKRKIAESLVKAIDQYFNKASNEK
jgi:N-acetylmuramoyl-L-alanine amidase